MQIESLLQQEKVVNYIYFLTTYLYHNFSFMSDNLCVYILNI